jgi:hypothetical protein
MADEVDHKLIKNPVANHAIAVYTFTSHLPGLGLPVGSYKFGVETTISEDGVRADRGLSYKELHQVQSGISIGPHTKCRSKAWFNPTVDVAASGEGHEKLAKTLLNEAGKRARSFLGDKMACRSVHVDGKVTYSTLRIGQ